MTLYRTFYAAGPSKSKRPRRLCHFDKKWVTEFPGISSSKGKCLGKIYCYLVSIFLAVKIKNNVYFIKETCMQDALRALLTSLYLMEEAMS